MAYTAWSVVFGEQPTAAKWNQLGENDAGFKTGDNIDDNAILARHILDGVVTSPKLAEAFVRSRYQSNTTNSAPTGLTIQHGWGFMLGDADDTTTEAVTFPVAFTTLYSIQVSALGSKSGSDPSGITDFSSQTMLASAMAPSTTGFTALVADYDGTAIASTVRVGYSWIAIGVV